MTERKTTSGYGSGFEYPPYVVGQVLREAIEVVPPVSELSGDRELKKTVGAIEEERCQEKS